VSRTPVLSHHTAFEAGPVTVRAYSPKCEINGPAIIVVGESTIAVMHLRRHPLRVSKLGDTVPISKLVG